MSGGDDEDLLTDLPWLGVVGEEDPRHEEEFDFDVGQSEVVGLDADASGEDVIEAASLLHAPDPAEKAWVGEEAEGLADDEGHHVDADEAEYGWAEFGDAPGDDDWDADFHVISSPPEALDRAESGDGGLDDELLDEPLLLPPLDAGGPDDEPENAELENFLRPEDFESPLGVDR